MNELQSQSTGMSLAAESNRQWLLMARAIALKIGKERGFSSIEDIRGHWPYEVFPYGNWCGAIFKDGNWRHYSIIPAIHEGSHGRWVRVWEFNPVKNTEIKLPIEISGSVMAGKSRFPMLEKKTSASFPIGTQGELFK